MFAEACAVLNFGAFMEMCSTLNEHWKHVLCRSMNPISSRLTFGDILVFQEPDLFLSDIFLIRFCNIRVKNNTRDIGSGNAKWVNVL